MKRNIIFSNNKNKLDKILKNIHISELYIIRIKYDKHSQEIIDYLKNKRIRTEFIKGDNFIKDYEKIYSGFIGELNIKNNNLSWWALNLTNKNPITTYLCDRVYYAILINKIISEDKFRDILIIDNDNDLYNQIKLNFIKNRNIIIFNAIKNFNFKKVIKDILPIAIIYIFLITILEKIVSLIYLKKIKIDKPFLVIMSLLYKPSFKNNRYQDVYFGKFIDYLITKRSNFISFMWVFDSYTDMLKKAKIFAKKYNIYPKEYFICFRSICACLLISLIKFFTQFEPKYISKLCDTDISYLLNKYIRYEYNSTRFFNNLLMFYSVRDICIKWISIKNFYYPFENRSFEKMIILALRRFSPKTKIIGYQHASLSLRHTNFLLTKEEAKITPLPDIIITMGEITKEIMESIGNFPKEILRVGCALRQSVYKGTLKNKPKKIINVFVALATGIEEYVKVLNFLNLAFMNNNIYNLWIRPHPVFSLEEAINLLGDFNLKFHKADKETLEECFTFSDIVLYVHSTLSLEALLRGIPLINIDIGEPINPDPLFNFEDFKWKVDKPENLIPTMQYIDSLNEASFRLGQEKGRIFAQRYIYEVTKERLEDFISV